MTKSGEVIWAGSNRDLPAVGLRHFSDSFMSGARPAEYEAGSPHVAVIDSYSLTRESIASNISYRFDDIKVITFLSVPDFNDRKFGQFGLIILYLHAAECHPLDVIRSLRSAHSRSIVFLISEDEYQISPDFIRAAWELGARGFVLTKTTGLALALSAIRFVQSGGFFAPFDELLSMVPTSPKPTPLLLAGSDLTARETVVLGLVKEGKTNKVIARELRLSSNTVKVHVHNILRKMKVSNRTEAALILSRRPRRTAPCSCSSEA
jgi:DNA-binding NarL/FixJ family response regulator